MTQDKGASLRDREPASGLGHSAGIPSTDNLGSGWLWFLALFFTLHLAHAISHEGLW